MPKLKITQDSKTYSSKQYQQAITLRGWFFKLDNTATDSVDKDLDKLDSEDVKRICQLFSEIENSLPDYLLLSTEHRDFQSTDVNVNVIKEKYETICTGINELKNQKLTNGALPSSTDIKKISVRLHNFYVRVPKQLTPGLLEQHRKFETAVNTLKQELLKYQILKSLEETFTKTVATILEGDEDAKARYLRQLNDRKTGFLANLEKLLDQNSAEPLKVQKINTLLDNFSSYFKTYVEDTDDADTRKKSPWKKGKFWDHMYELLHTIDPSQKAGSKDLKTWFLLLASLVIFVGFTILIASEIAGFDALSHANFITQQAQILHDGFSIFTHFILPVGNDLLIVGLKLAMDVMIPFSLAISSAIIAVSGSDMWQKKTEMSIVSKSTLFQPLRETADELSKRSLEKAHGPQKSGGSEPLIEEQPHEQRQGGAPPNTK